MNCEEYNESCMKKVRDHIDKTKIMVIQNHAKEKKRTAMLNEDVDRTSGFLETMYRRYGC